MNTADQAIIDTLVGHSVTAVAGTADRDGNEAAVTLDDRRLPLLDIDGQDDGWYGLGYTVRALAPGRTLTEEARQGAHWDACRMPGLDEQQTRAKEAPAMTAGASFANPSVSGGGGCSTASPPSASRTPAGGAATRSPPGDGTPAATSSQTCAAPSPRPARRPGATPPRGRASTGR